MYLVTEHKSPLTHPSKEEGNTAKKKIIYTSKDDYENGKWMICDHSAKQSDLFYSCIIINFVHYKFSGKII